MNQQPDRTKQQSLESIRALARILDDAVPIPGTEYRIGLDPLLGLFPGIGDSVSGMCSAIILLQAARLGAPKRYLLKMLVNLTADACIGAVPLLGDLFDFTFKANRRNLDLLLAIPEHEWGDPRTSKSSALLLFAIAISIMLCGVVAGIYLLKELISFVL